MRTLIYAWLLSSSLSAWGAPPTVSGVAGASNYIASGTPTIYGGVSGTDCSASASSNLSTCSSCAQTLTACNTNRIYDNLVLRINLTHADAGNGLLAKSDGTVQSNLQVTSPGSNNGDFVDIKWQSICSLMGTATCEAASSSFTTNPLTLRIYIDKDRDSIIDTGEEYVDVSIRVFSTLTIDYDVFNSGEDGLETFTPYPGDEKIYITEPNTSTSFPSFDYGGKATKIRIFGSSVNMTEANPVQRTFEKEVNLDDSGAIINNIVSGLENGTTYAFRAALVDEANNVLQFTPDSGTACDGSPIPIPPTCAFSATPDEVLGLLSDDFNCFVASAAYGTSLEPKLNVFRAFRNKVLLRTNWGLNFVKSYYKYGPYAARFIHDKPFLRFATRTVLWPAYGFSQLALRFGFWTAFVFSSILISLLFSLPFIRVRSLSKRA